MVQKEHCGRFPIEGTGVAQSDRQENVSMTSRPRPSVVMLRYARSTESHRARRGQGGRGAGAPSDLPTSPSKSAVITGRINDASATPEWTGSNEGLTVKVTGTSVSSAVASDGQFTLRGVPPGTAKLHITGADVDATITIPGVEMQDEIQVAVTIEVLPQPELPESRSTAAIIPPVAG
jgi:hypothetical protein